MSGCGFRYRLGANALLNPQLGRRRMTHLEAAVCDGGGCDDLEIILGPEVADFQFAQADDGQRWRLDPTDPDHAANAGGQQCLRRGPGKGELKI